MKDQAGSTYQPDMRKSVHIHHPIQKMSKLTHHSAALVLILCAANAVAQFNTMREAILIETWFVKFEFTHSECQEIQRTNPANQPDIPRHFQNIKAVCSASRYGQAVIPEDVQVEIYKIMKAGRDCAIQLATDLVRGGEGRLRIDAIPSLTEDEKQTLRKKLGDPISETLQRCEKPMNQLGALRKSARTANGKRAFE